MQRYCFLVNYANENAHLIFAVGERSLTAKALQNVRLLRLTSYRLYYICKVKFVTTSLGVRYHPAIAKKCQILRLLPCSQQIPGTDTAYMVLAPRIFLVYTLLMSCFKVLRKYIYVSVMFRLCIGYPIRRYREGYEKDCK